MVGGGTNEFVNAIVAAEQIPASPLRLVVALRSGARLNTPQPVKVSPPHAVVKKRYTVSS